MRINALQLGNWKGIDGNIEVGHLNLFLGPNGSGKSARLLGLAWAITGETPIGAMAETAAAYAGEDGCQVGVALDDGFSWARSLTRDPKKGGMKHGVEVPAKPNLKISDAIEAVSQHVGDFAPQFDLGRFLDLSDDKRRAFALALCAKITASVSRNELLGLTIASCLKEKLGEEAVKVAHTMAREGESVIEILMKSLDAKYTAALNEHLKTVDHVFACNLDQTTAIGNAIETASTLANDAKRARDNSQKAARKVADDKAALVTVAKTMQQLEGERDKLKADRESLIKQIEHQKGRASAKGSLEQGLEKKRDKLAKAKAALEKVRGEEIPDAATAASLREAAEQLKTEASDASIAPELNERWTAALTENARLAGVQQVLQQKLKFSRDAWKRQGDVVTSVTNNSWVRLGQLLLKLKPLTGEMPSKGVRELLAEMSEIVAAEARALNPEKAKAELDNFALTVRAFETEITATAKQVTESKAAVERLRAEVAEQQGKVSGARRREQNLENERQSMLMQALKIEEQIAKHGRQEIEAQTAVTNAEQDVQEATESLEALRREGGFVDDAELREQVTRLESQQVEAEKLINDKNRFQTLEAELQKCIADGETEEISHEAGKDLVAALKSVREALMVEVVKPLLSKIDKFLAAAWPGMTSYCELVNERNKPVFDLGWTTEGAKRISLSAMSGGEAALFKAALAYALVSLSDVPLKVLLLEAAEIDYKHMHMVMTGCEEIAAELSNVFIATYLEIEDVSAKWHVEKMEWQAA